MQKPRPTMSSTIVQRWIGKERITARRLSIIPAIRRRRHGKRLALSTKNSVVSV
ncbi:MAG: hypothetical protein M3297_02885 [Thermoproteota archaeon]|nr:hypothetical protein [Thermoproteota archaeon]